MRKINYAPTISREEIASLPLKKFNGKIYVVEHLDYLDEAISYLSKQYVLGFDTEAKPQFRKGKKSTVSLLQLSTNQRAYLFRINKTGFPGSLKALLSNEEIIKVGVAIHDDIKDLVRISHFNPKGFIDLQQFVKQFNIESNGLKKLAAIVMNIRISKSQQLSNWEEDILSEAQISYAATDAWVCYEIYSQLIAKEHSSEIQHKQNQL